MTNDEIEAVFANAYDGKKNSTTPYVVRYGEIGEVIYELAEGIMFNKVLYGISVLEKDGTKREDLNKCSFSLKEAEEYIASLA